MVDNKVNESRSVGGGDKLPAQIEYIYIITITQRDTSEASRNCLSSSRYILTTRY